MLKEGIFLGKRYEILGRVGSGGMADVYKGKDHKLNRYVAVKVLKSDFRQDEVFIQKFLSEAQAAAGLMHPNVVNVYDVGQDRGLYYMVMELVEGITLKEYIEKKGKLSAKEKKAKKVTIPKTVTINNVKYQVTGIAAKTFKNSKKLQTVVIPDTVTEIGTGSFEGCKKLKSVTIGKNVTSIGKNAFKNCKNLKKITVKSTKLKKVGKGALTGINRKCVIKVPKKQLKSYKRLFKGKGQKKSVKIKK